MKKILPAMSAGAILLGTWSCAIAAPIGGLEVVDGPVFGVGQIYENVPTQIGDTLAGYGNVDSINSIPIGRLCTDCELTYRFGGYTVSAVTPTEIRFTGGFTNTSVSAPPRISAL
jgi:hypothetical protein